MAEIIEPFVIGVRFSKVGKVYHFSASDVTDVKIGDMVVVETTRGWQLGQVAQVLDDVDPPPDGWKTIDRRATPRDLLLRQMWQMKESEVVDICRSRASELRLNGVKIVSAEYSFDGARLTILFSTETEEKYDLKSLRQDMQKQFGPSQVDLRQVGPRDVAKVHCGMGACGLETRCCCLFLTEFSSISIRMAKEQGISLTPSEITGMCGRLRCCLIYEYDTYVDARQKLPKRNKRVRTPQGDGKVVDIVPLRSSVIVEIPEVGHKEFPAADVVEIDENTPPLVIPPLQVTRQPSEIDQAVVGEAPEEPFSNKPGQTTEGRAPSSENKPRFQRRPGRDRREPQQNQPGTPDQQKKPTGSSGQKWKNTEQKPNQPQTGSRTNQPKPEAGSGTPQQRTRRDNRRKRGRRHDSNPDTQN